MEKVYGADAWPVRTRQIRFLRDGSFVTNARGELSSDEVGARGRYRLEGELLTVGVFQNDGCAAPSTATWRVTVRNDQMSMVWIHGVCPGGRTWRCVGSATRPANGGAIALSDESPQVRSRYFLMQCTTPCRSANALKSASRWTSKPRSPQICSMRSSIATSEALSAYPNVGM